MSKTKRIKVLEEFIRLEKLEKNPRKDYIEICEEAANKLKKELKLEDRIYSCTCGNQMNRDENAAINICREGLRISGVELETERKIS